MGALKKAKLFMKSNFTNCPTTCSNCRGELLEEDVPLITSVLETQKSAKAKVKKSPKSNLNQVSPNLSRTSIKYAG